MAAKKHRKSTHKKKTSHKKKSHHGTTLAKLNTRVTHLERFIGSGPH